MFVLNGVLVKVVSGRGFIVEVVNESKSKQLTYNTATSYCELLTLLKGEQHRDTVKEVITTHEALNSVVSMIVNNIQLVFNVTHVGCLREELTDSI